jgi:hypothetical protein
MLAYCYESIATEETLSAVRAYDSQSIEPLVAEVVRFKAITLSILISIAGIIARNNFAKLDHAWRSIFVGASWRRSAPFLTKV